MLGCERRVQELGISRESGAWAGEDERRPPMATAPWDADELRSMGRPDAAREMPNLAPFFEIVTRHKLARTGIIHTPHGDIHTPAFVGAATRAAVKTLTMQQMHALGSQAILANTYHLLLAPGPGLVQSAGGLAQFCGWHAPTFTDSGGFQIFSLPGTKITESGATFKSHLDGRVFTLTPEVSMQAQWAIGADIHMAFDHLARSTSRADMEQAMHRTHAWLARCIKEHQSLATAAAKASAPPQYLYAVVQGGDFLDLREQSARYCASVHPDGFGIGGIFTAAGMAELLDVVHAILPADKPRHLLGMGQEPRDLFIGATHGCDTFDCVGPTRLARNGTLYTPDGRLNIKNARFRTDFSPVDPTCPCLCCTSYTRAYLHHLFKVDEITAKVLASIHNESFIVRTVDHIRESLSDGTFEAYQRDFLARYYH